MLTPSKRDLDQAIELGKLLKRLFGIAAQSAIDAAMILQMPDIVVRSTIATEAMLLASYMIAVTHQRNSFMRLARSTFQQATNNRQQGMGTPNGEPDDEAPVAIYADELKPILALVDAVIAAKGQTDALNFLEELGQALDDRIDTLTVVGT